MDTLVRKIRQRVPLATINAPKNIQFFPTLSQQELLLDEIRKCAERNPYYASQVLKSVVNKLEQLQKDDDTILDGIYEEIFNLISEKPLEPTDTDILSYALKSDPSDPSKDRRILIKESPRLLSGMGTTGLRTWEASLFLSQYLIEVLENDDDSFDTIRRDFQNKTILELGCGTGFVGLTLYKYLSDKINKIVFTDGDTQLIDRIASNFSLNNVSLDSEKVKVNKLWWGEDNLPNMKIDTIVAADVTYDASVIPDLAEVLDEAMSQDNGKFGRVNVAYIAATVRNEKTIATWERYLDMGKSDEIWTWEIIESSKYPKHLHTTLESKNQWNNVWYPVGVSEIRIYRLERNDR